MGADYLGFLPQRGMGEGGGWAHESIHGLSHGVSAWATSWAGPMHAWGLQGSWGIMSMWGLGPCDLHGPTYVACRPWAASMHGACRPMCAPKQAHEDLHGPYPVGPAWAQAWGLHGGEEVGGRTRMQQSSSSKLLQQTLTLFMAVFFFCEFS